MIISMIYTASQDGVLGHNNSALWDQGIEFHRNRAVTLDRTLIMGRHTWELLPSRIEPQKIIVLSSNALSDETIAHAVSLEAGLNMARVAGCKEVVIVGGAKLFQEAMGYAHVIYKLTLLIEVKGNIRAPSIPVEHFKLVWVKNVKSTPSYSYQTFINRELKKYKLSDDFGVLI